MYRCTESTDKCMEVEKKGKVGDKRLAVAADDERTRISKTPVSHFHESSGNHGK